MKSVPYAEILHDAYDYWFGDLPGPGQFPSEKVEMWFNQSDATDSYIREKFESQLRAIAGTDWPLADMSRLERVGVVIFLDQFPRNIFRESAAAFAYDPIVRHIAEELAGNNFREYLPVERVFLVLPFVHSEAMADQDRAIALMEDLLASVDDRRGYDKAMEQAVRHRGLILRFGRFPHRNAVLGRTSTPEELAFAREHGRGY